MSLPRIHLVPEMWLVQFEYPIALEEKWWFVTPDVRGKEWRRRMDECCFWVAVCPTNQDWDL